MAIVSQEMYVKTDIKENNNKFWEVTLHDDGRVTTRNGRVGASGQNHDLGSGGQALYNSKVREKLKGGYKKVDIVSAAPKTAQSANNEMVKSAAEEQIANGNPVLAQLVRKLAEANRHQILMASGGQMDINLSTGIVTTPVGVVTLSNVQSARNFLPKFESFVVSRDFDNHGFMDMINEYLMLVPQKVAAQRGWHRGFLPDMSALVKQNALLDQLEASIELAEKEVEAQKKKAMGEIPKVFDVQLSLVEDGKIISAIEKYFFETVNRQHSCSHLKPKRVFEIAIGPMKEAWEKDGASMKNIQQLWHGTRTHNVLSIMKGGLVVPRSGGSIQVTGRMFGDGLYFSDQSSKALNYAYGYWDGGSRDNNCFMFLADVAMGKSYTPSGPTGSRPLPKGYDSTFAKARESGVMNNEMIVYRTSQANLRYLIEFGA